jgi:predicted transcriptional regulator
MMGQLINGYTAFAFESQKPRMYMKQLKSNSQNLKDLFEQTITARFIAEPFRSFDANSDTSNVLSFMETQDYDVVGIRRKGLIVGYVAKDELSDSAVLANVQNFDSTELIVDTTTLVEVFKLLRVRPRVYVIYLNEVSGIVTKGDLQKAPVRMWLFGLISLLEMQLLRLIRGCYPNESWTGFLKEARLNEARKLFEKRKAKNEEVDLADCLQFCDKREILKSSDEIRSLVGIESKKQVNSLLEKAERLRNNLAHAQDIITGFWPEVADTVERISSLLEDMEKVDFSGKCAV